jgi:hypothetical protein
MGREGGLLGGGGDFVFIATDFEICDGMDLITVRKNVSMCDPATTICTVPSDVPQLPSSAATTIARGDLLLSPAQHNV